MPDIAHGFQIHPSRESSTVTTEVLQDLATENERWRIGATLQVPRQRLAYWRRASSEWRQTSDFIVADPETTRMERPYADRGRGRRDYAYLSESDPIANPNRFVGDVLEAQEQAGATVFVSPWLRHGVTQTDNELAATLQFAEIASETVGDDVRLLMGVEATQGVFANREARNSLVNELVEGPELPVYLRMYVTAPRSYTQYKEKGALEGLATVVRALEANDRPVALPQSGLCGWLMCAFGARSFGAGISASMQRNSAPSGGGGGLPPLHWYFVPQLLGFAQAEEMEDVAEVDEFSACECPYCDGELPGTGAAFDAEAAGKHFLWCCAALGAELDPDDPAQAVVARVEAASAFFAALNNARVALDSRSQPHHLAVWENLLQQA